MHIAETASLIAALSVAS